MSRARSARASRTTLALILKRVEHGESDLVLQFFTKDLGKLSALARAARKSRKRFGGTLEPFQTIELVLDEPVQGELFHLREARIETTRLALTSSLEAMDAAGRALGWVRSASPVRTPEPEVWSALAILLDRLEAGEPPGVVLGEQGLLLLSAFGWGLDLSRCVRCGTPCEPGRAAMIDPVRGGLVCRKCGGARIQLKGAQRARIAEVRLLPEDVPVALSLIEQALKAHAGI